VGQRRHGKGRGLNFFSMKEEKKIINWEHNILYTTEQDQQLREQCLLVIGCHI